MAQNKPASNKPAPEQSMDDILASIRKIISDDGSPPTPAAPPAPEASTDAPGIGRRDARQPTIQAEQTALKPAAPVLRPLRDAVSSTEMRDASKSDAPSTLPSAPIPSAPTPAEAVTPSVATPLAARLRAITNPNGDAPDDTEATAPPPPTRDASADVAAPPAPSRPLSELLSERRAMPAPPDVASDAPMPAPDVPTLNAAASDEVATEQASASLEAEDDVSAEASPRVEQAPVAPDAPSYAAEPSYGGGDDYASFETTTTTSAFDADVGTQPSQAPQSSQFGMSEADDETSVDGAQSASDDTEPTPSASMGMAAAAAGIAGTGGAAGLGLSRSGGALERLRASLSGGEALARPTDDGPGSGAPEAPVEAALETPAPDMSAEPTVSGSESHPVEAEPTPERTSLLDRFATQPSASELVADDSAAAVSQMEPAAVAATVDTADVSAPAASSLVAPSALLASDTATAAGGGQPQTLEQVVAEMLRPAMGRWLDQNLEPIVARVLAEELDKRSLPTRDDS